MLARAAVCSALLAGCAVPPANAVYDFAAIHDDQWRPRSPAVMRESPEVYMGSGKDTPALFVGELPSYSIADHRAVESGILRVLERTPAADLTVSLEVTAYLCIALLHDDFPEVRVQAAAILSQFAGFWIERAGARPAPVEPDGDLAAAVAAYEAATADPQAPGYAAATAAALERIDAARLADPQAAALLVAGMGRRYRQGSVPVTGDQTLQRTAVRTILLALERGAADPDPEVARTCAERRALILDYLRRTAS